jgi:pseudouridine-5'-phosphate glycosidase/pseudouridine kinase
VIVLGGAAVDIISKANPSSGGSFPHNTTVSGSVTSSLGGVARNVAEAAHRILYSSSPSNKDTVLLISPVGADPFGNIVRDGVSALGMRTDGILVSQISGEVSSHTRTAVCNMVLDGKCDLMAGIADMDITHSLNFSEVSI